MPLSEDHAAPQIPKPETYEWSITPVGSEHVVGPLELCIIHRTLDSHSNVLTIGLLG